MSLRRTPALLASTALVGGLVLLAPSGAGGQDPGGCTQPYAPVWFDEVPASSGETLDEPAVEADPVPPGAIRQDGAPDTDGDGTDDTIDAGTDTVTITRGDGELVLTVTGTDEISAARVGDLDGDGRDEIVVRAGWTTPAPDADEPTDGAFLIPGTTAAGTYEAADAGIALGTDIVTAMAPPERPDLLLAVHPYDVGTPTRTEVRSAAEVLALGPGGDATTLPPDVEAAGLVPQLTVDLGDSAVALVLAATGSISTDHMELGVLRGTELTRFTTEPERYYASYTSLLGDLTVLGGADGTFLRLQQEERAGTGLYWWGIDDPCTALVAAEEPPPAAPPTAPPATPVDAEAAFTG